MPKRRNKRGGAAGSPAAKQLCTDSNQPEGVQLMEGVESLVKQPSLSPTKTIRPDNNILTKFDNEPTKVGCENEAHLRACQVSSTTTSTSGAEAMDTASNGQTVPTVKEVTEGKATVLYPESVFYNQVQEFNRDLSVCVISEYSREIAEASGVTVSDAGVKPETGGIRILEALGASGLRSVRFALEIPGVKEIVCNDFDESAVQYIKQNVLKNNVAHLVRANKGDAALVMQQCRSYDSKYDVIDLDPYGSPSHFLDGAVQAIKNGGLLCVTATDMAVMSGNFGETCFTKYGSYAVRSKACHEMGLRILLHSIEQHATRYSKYTVPILSVSADFYIRVFVRVYESAALAKFSASKQGLIYQCNGCTSQAVQPLGYSFLQEDGNYKHQPAVGPPVGRRCDHCGERHKMAGPLWIGRLHDQAFVERLGTLVEPRKHLGTHRRMVGMLKMIHEELEDVVVYHVLDDLCKVLHCTVIPSVKFKSALLNAGYQVSGTHAHRNGVKTNAPPSVVWDILRLWVSQNPVSQKRLVSDSVARTILEISPSITVSFEKHQDANPESREKGLLRFQMNPEKDWGPKAKAKADASEKKKTKRDKWKKQKPCHKFFSTNPHECPSGDECPYSHDPEVLKQKNKKKPCSQLFGAEAKCDLGEDCPYSHDPEVYKNYTPYGKRFPCRKFLKGDCPLPEISCKNHHQGPFYIDAKGEKKPLKSQVDAKGNDAPNDDMIGQAISESSAGEQIPVLTNTGHVMGPNTGGM